MMPAQSKPQLTTDEFVMSKIYLIREQKVMMDFDLAELYGIETKMLKRAVKRNMQRFPPDFMFELSQDEQGSLRRQFGTLKRGEHSKYKPYAFTEQGVAMLSSVLNSPTAINVNIQIIRVFTKMRSLLLTHKDILLKLEKMEKKLGKHDEQIALVFRYLKKLLNPPQPVRTRIGFRRKDEKD